MQGSGLLKYLAEHRRKNGSRESQANDCTRLFLGSEWVSYITEGHLLDIQGMGLF